MQNKYRYYAALIALAVIQGCKTSNEIVYEQQDGWTLIRQSKGLPLGYSPSSGVSILEKDGFAFKDLDRDGELDPYEDWRLPFEKRSKDLSSKLSIDEIAGLMIYFPGQNIMDSVMTEEHLGALAEGNIRHILFYKVASPRVAAVWNNNEQAYVEALGHGIPANNASDPRNYNESTGEFNAGSGGLISRWPREIGLGATMDMDVIADHARVVAREYRALGIATALSPQVDLSSEPRWRRAHGTFSEDPDLNADIARVYCDGFQESEGDKEIRDGWGWGSVNCMVKHWPGGGAEECGRDAHYSFGKFAVYPGNNFQMHLIPFLKGAFALKGKTRKASAVMPYYTISYGQDPSGKNVGNAFSHYIITDLLRKKYDYDGVVCTDWGVTRDYGSIGPGKIDGKPWGVEGLSVTERHYEALKAGVDQFGGNRYKSFIIEAYQMWVDEFGEESARQRFELSAQRLLMNIFRTGLFENPYVDPGEAEKIVGCEEFMKAGYEGQLKSVVMLKNHENVLPIAERKTVYLPKRLFSEDKSYRFSIDSSTVSSYFDVTSDPDKADFAVIRIVGIMPVRGWDGEDFWSGGNGYIPISLQYRPYTAEFAREGSIGGLDPKDKGPDRSYKGKTVKADNEADLDLVVDTKKAMGDKPVIVAVQLDRPLVMAEFEPYADAILCSFGVDNRCLLDIINGRFEPYGLLPVQMPADMRTVEEQCEDIPRDMRCYKDEDGHFYDFAYGLNWSGVIEDSRVKTYR